MSFNEQTVLFRNIAGSRLYGTNIETNKNRLFSGCQEAVSTASKIFEDLIYMFHPFTPFVTQDIANKAEIKNIMNKKFF